MNDNAGALQISPILTEAMIFAMCVDKMVNTGLIGLAAPHFCALDIAGLQRARAEWEAKNKPNIVLPTSKEVSHIDSGKNK